jgi:hypothetical protein
MKRGWQSLLGVAALVSGVACGSDTLTGPPDPALFGQYTLSGTVSHDSQSGWEPSQGARVLAVFEGGELSAATGEDGTFRISGLPAGIVSIYVTKDGYKAAHRRVTLKGNQVLDVQLRQEHQTLQ